ncbi:MAG: hypothetical protein M3144_03200, partial [Actinomycetota bacterium]|nr:hypothetical protein [Actinomycetota bacterium]
MSSANQPAEEKAKRRAARELIAAYHQEQLRALLEHVRDGFAQLDAGEIDEFDLDDLIHRYKRAATDLWKFCGNTGGQWLQAANTLAYLRDQGEEPRLVGQKRVAEMRDRPEVAEGVAHRTSQPVEVAITGGAVRPTVPAVGGLSD